MPYEELLDDINVGLQAFVRDDIRFPVAEELLPLPILEHLQFARDNIPPPGALLLSADEQIFVDVFNSLAGNVLNLGARLLRPNGELVIFFQQFTPTSDRTRSTFVMPGYEGALLSVIMGATIVTSLTGTCFVTLSTGRGTTATRVLTQMLAGGYITNASSFSWPPGRLMNAPEGPGRLRLITGTNPAAGVEISETVPTNARWRLRSIRFSFTASADVATRRVRLVVDDGTTTIWRTDAQITQVASTARTYHFGRGQVTDSLNVIDTVNYGLPPFVLPAAARFSTLTVSLQALDNYGPPVYQVEEWLDV